MEYSTSGETHPHRKGLREEYEREGFGGRSFLKDMMSTDIMRGIHGLVSMKHAYNIEGHRPQDWGAASKRSPFDATPIATVDSEREIGAKALNRWLEKIPSTRHDQFFDLLGDYEKAYENYQKTGETATRSKSYSNLQEFLGENLLMIRRPPIEDQLIGSMKAKDEGILGE